MPSRLCAHVCCTPKGSTACKGRPPIRLPCGCSAQCFIALERCNVSLIRQRILPAPAAACERAALLMLAELAPCRHLHTLMDQVPVQASATSRAPTPAELAPCSRSADPSSSSAARSATITVAAPVCPPARMRACRLHQPQTFNPSQKAPALLTHCAAEQSRDGPADMLVLSEKKAQTSCRCSIPVERTCNSRLHAAMKHGRQNRPHPG